jgi:hypothetical protein
MHFFRAFSLIFGFAIVAGCQGPDEFYRLSDAGDKTGTAGSSSPGAGGFGGQGTAGTSAAGSAGNSGAAGSILAGTGGSADSTGSGGAPGAAGSSGGDTSSRGGTTGAGGAGGSSARGGTTGTGGAGTGSGGSAGSSGGATSTGGSSGAAGSSARGGTTGSGGAGGSSARGGTTGAGGIATGGASGGAGGRGPDRIQVVAKCQPNNDAQNIRVTFKILNPESTKQLSDVKIRYYFTPNMPLAPMVTYDFLQKFTAAQLTATTTPTYVEIGFTTSAGTLAGFDNVTGTDQIQLRIYNFSTPTWNTTWTDDYSYKSCTGVSNTDAFADRLTMTGYYQGNLAWGNEPTAGSTP